MSKWVIDFLRKSGCLPEPAETTTRTVTVLSCVTVSVSLVQTMSELLSPARPRFCALRIGYGHLFGMPRGPMPRLLRR